MARLKEEIIARIEKEPDQLLSFREYMALCLYHPEEGYYMKARPKIGKEGDYYTSSSVHPVFAETIASYIVRLFDAWDRPVAMCELGAGNGRFARQFLDALAAHHPEAYRQVRYYIMERSPYHRSLQLEALDQHTARVVWVQPNSGEGGVNDATEEKLSAFEGILFSNELVDALPVYRVEKEGGRWWELCVGYDRTSRQFVERKRPLNHGEIIAYLKEQEISVPDGWRMEIPLDALAWVEQVASWFKAGLWLTIDYGFRHREWREPHYRQGTLRCYYRHQLDDNPYSQPGEKDITAHVHFDALIRRAGTLGWSKVSLSSQAEFLLMAGILDQLEEVDARDPFHPTAKKNRAVRHLLAGDGISSAFQVLTLSKGVPDKVLRLFSPFSIDAYLHLSPP